MAQGGGEAIDLVAATQVRQLWCSNAMIIDPSYQIIFASTVVKDERTQCKESSKGNVQKKNCDETVRLTFEIKARSFSKHCVPFGFSTIFRHSLLQGKGTKN